MFRAWWSTSWSAGSGLLLAMAVAACGDDTAPAGDAAVQIRDSAGVRIVEYAATPDIDGPFVFSSQPVYSHGVDSGDYLFQYIWNGRLLPDGGAVVSDPENGELVLFDSVGAFAGVLGSSGEGPGDVGGGTRSLIVSGRDSILAEDVANQQYTLFVRGSPARTVAFRGTPSLMLLRTLGVDSAGRLLMSTYGWPGRLQRPERDTWLAGYTVRLDLDTRVFDTVMSYDGMLDEARGRPYNPFVHHGEVTVADGRFVRGRSDRAELLWHRSDGGLSQILRWQPRWIYPGSELWDQFIDTWRLSLDRRPGMTDDQRREEIRQARLNYRPIPEEPIPLYGFFFGDGEGRIWISDYEPGALLEGASGYTLIGPGGEWLGRIEAPMRMRLLDVSGGRVLAAVRDDMDVESIVVYELVGS